MTTELIELEPRPAVVPEAREGSLTWRASLNLVQSVLDYSAKLGVGLVVVPLLVSGIDRRPAHPGTPAGDLQPSIG
jgi:hypothetical protein